MTDATSQELFERAQAHIPGGVNSPARAFSAVGGTPIFIDRAHGPYLVGADGKEYVDYVSSWGPMILGHAHPEVIAAIKEAADRGTSYGAPTEAEIRMADALCEALPSMEMVRLTSSGTEACMGALRAARGFTGRDLVVKCEGAYHGGADYLLVKAGSAATTLGEPSSAGVPASIAQTTTVIRHNDPEALEEVFAARGDEIAALIIEPVAGNMGCVPPAPGWLEKARQLTSKHGSVLVFDEVMCGFRVAFGGAQSRYGVTPDMTCLAKVVGGGLPLGAYGGRREIMERVAPLGPVSQAGTLSGNPLAVAAGLKTLELLAEPTVFDRLEAAGLEVATLLEEGAQAAGVPCTVQRVGSMVTPFFTDHPVVSFDDAKKADTERFGRFHQALIERGVHWPPSQFEAGFVSLAHDEDALTRTRSAVREAFALL